MSNRSIVAHQLRHWRHHWSRRGVGNGKKTRVPEVVGLLLDLALSVRVIHIRPHARALTPHNIVMSGNFHGDAIFGRGAQSLGTVETEG